MPKKPTTAGEGPETPAAATKAPVRYGWLSVVIAVIVGLFYAFDLFTAINNLVTFPQEIAAKNVVRAGVGTDLIATPWPLLIVGLLVPLVAYAIAFLLGRRRSILVRAVLLVLGLVAVSAISLSLVAIAFRIVPAA